jgi:hypothetical protein
MKFAQIIEFTTGGALTNSMPASISGWPGPKAIGYHIGRC